jgi:phosphoenolpyruvate carboxykinase (ATP)
MNIKDTRKIIDAIHDGSLEKVKTNKLSIFGLNVPDSCPGVDAKVLNPKETWHNKNEYDATLKKLAEGFVKNFQKYADKGSPDILKAGPKL